MRGLVQRVLEAQVTSSSNRAEPGEIVGRIGAGLVLLVGATHDDDEAAAVRLADKVYNLRIFDDGDGAMNLSCGDIGGQILVVSQFTLYGDARKGRRPSFVAAARPEVAEPLVEQVIARLRELGARPEGGRFQTHMRVSLVNDGPVTLMIEV